MDLHDIMRAIVRGWWLVLAATILAVGAAGVSVLVAEPQYATSVTFFVTTPSDGTSESYQGGLFSAQRVTSYADLLKGDRLARAIADSGQIGLTPAEIQQRITARPVPDTVLLDAAVTDSDPARSERIARALGEQFAALISTLETPPGAKTSRAKVEVVAGPTLDPVPVSPRPTRTLTLAALLGLLIGAGAAVLREQLDVTVKTTDMVSTVTGAAVLGSVPFDAGAKRAPLVMDGDSHSARAEAFRHLRTNLQYVDVDEPLRVIAITSSVPEEGKSTTAVNLAIAFAKSGCRVLLIEADMRRPKVAEYLGLEGVVGLSNVLAGLVPFETVLQRWGRHELYVLASGFVPPNPSELLGSRNMATLLERERENFDVILIDTPPLLPVTDAAVVATHADGVLLAVRADKTPQNQVRMAVAALEAVDARLLGCVFNMKATKVKSDYYAYAYGMTPSRRHPAQRRDEPAAPLSTTAPADGPLDEQFDDQVRSPR